MLNNLFYAENGFSCIQKNSLNRLENKMTTPGLTIQTPASPTFSPVSTPGSTSSFNSALNRLDARMAANALNPFSTHTVNEAAANLARENARAAEQAKIAAAEANRLAKALIKDRNYNVRNIIPIDFKGDGIGFTAGYGYSFKKNKGFGNFVKGFPLKYYRVYGNSMNNITQKIIRLRKEIDDAAQALKNAKERAKAQQAEIKARFAQERAEARAAAKAAKNSRNALIQQERNAALSMMEAKRLTSRARVNVSVSKEAMNLAQAREFDLLKRNIAQKLQDPTDPVYGAYSRAGLRSFNELPENFRNEQLRRIRRSPAFANRVRKTARLPLSVLRQYNKARYAMGIGRTNRNKTIRATKGFTLGAPAFAKGTKNATAKNNRGFFGRLFGAKPKPTTTLGNAYSAMNTSLGSVGSAYSI